MAYTKHTWAANEIIDHTKLNHIEDGVAGTDAQFAELWEIVDEGQAAIGQIMENFQNKKLFFDMLHPVGSFYWTTAAGSPVAQGLSDGTWEQVTGRFLMAAGGGYTSGTTGGEASHLLTLNELPPHRHDVEIFTNHVSGSLPGGNAGYYYDNNSGTGFKTDYTPAIDASQQAIGIIPPYLAAYCWHRTA